MMVVVLATIPVLPVPQVNSPTRQPSYAMHAQLPAKLVTLQQITVLVANLALASKIALALNASMEPPLMVFYLAKTVPLLTAQLASPTVPVQTASPDSPFSATTPADTPAMTSFLTATHAETRTTQTSVWNVLLNLLLTLPATPASPATSTTVSTVVLLTSAMPVSRVLSPQVMATFVLFAT
jgi:hypothetical protein